MGFSVLAQLQLHAAPAIISATVSLSFFAVLPLIFIGGDHPFYPTVSSLSFYIAHTSYAG